MYENNMYPYGYPFGMMPMQYQQQNNNMPNRNYQPQTMPQQQPMLLYGKYVEGLDVVKAIDTPTDGNKYFYPTVDGKTIYAKQWLPNGTAPLTRYEIVADEQQKPQATNTSMDINVLIEQINSRFDRIEKAINKPKKKEGGSDE